MSSVVEAVRGERVFGVALRAMGGAMEGRIDQLFQVRLHATGELV